MTRDQARSTHTDSKRSAPVIRCRIRKSADGKFVLHATEITHIKPAAYYEAVLAGKPSEVEVEEVVA